MKILFLVMRFKRDGLSTNVVEIAKGLVEKGHEVSIITSGFSMGTSDDPDFFNRLKSDFQKLSIKLFYFKEPKGNHLRRNLSNLFGFLKIIHYLVTIKADIIHCHSPNMTFLPWIIGKKYIATIHAATISPNFRYKNPPLLIAVSSGTKRFAEEVMGANPNKVRIVNHGISKRFSEIEPAEKLEEIRSFYNIKGKIIIGFVGTLRALKGLDILLKAVNMLPMYLINRIHLLFIGDFLNESDEKWLENQISKNNLENKISIIPFCDPKPYYQVFDIFVLPSRSEAFGLVAVEAMMSGCCTVRSNTFGAEDQIENGKNGFVFSVGNCKELSEQLKMVIENDTLRGICAEKGKEKALNFFSKERMIENTIKAYTDL